VKYGFVMLMAAALTACVSDPLPQTARADPQEGIMCTNDVPVGSILRQRKCTTAAERELERRQSEHMIVIQPVPRGRGP
jgi:hypothetical protein